VFEASRKNLADVLPRTPEAYVQKISQLKMGEMAEFFDKFELMEFKLDNNLIEIKKGQQKLQFELRKWGDTQSVLKEIKAFKIDADSMSECIYYTKFFGPFNITKTNEDTFVFSKNNMSCELARYQK